MKKTITKKAVIKRTADVLEKLGVAGIAVAVFQGNMSTLGLSFFFLTTCYIFTLWEANLWTHGQDMLLQALLLLL